MGLGDTTERTIPVQVGTNTDWSAVAVGVYHSLALKNNGTLWGWGNNGNGELGTGDVTNYASPVRVGTDTDWSALAAGMYHSLALKNNGTLWAWGNNAYGQLGTGDYTNYAFSRSGRNRYGLVRRWSGYLSRLGSEIRWDLLGLGI